jgi:GT2 family glycosyltransferase
MEKTAIVILNWNGCEMMKRFLPSVIRHSSGNGRAVYVADNGSTDLSVSWLKENYPEIHLILLDHNYGFAEGYNQALQQIEAEYVVLLNSDVEVTEHWLTPLETYMDAHPDIAGCQPKIRSWHQPEFFEYAGAAGGFIDHYGYPYCRGRIQGKVEKDNGQYNTICPVFWATGAALFIRLEEYRKAGGLDGRFFAHMEEIDLCWRLRARGKKLVCIPESTVYHVGGGTLNRENPQKTFLNFRNNLLMLYKNLPERELKPVMRTRTLLDAAASLSFLLKGELGNARAVWRARKEFRRLVPSYKAVRTENLRLTVVDPIGERSKGCILFSKKKQYLCPD